MHAEIKSMWTIKANQNSGLYGECNSNVHINLVKWDFREVPGGVYNDGCILSRVDDCGVETVPHGATSQNTFLCKLLYYIRNSISLLASTGRIYRWSHRFEFTCSRK